MSRAQEIHIEQAHKLGMKMAKAMNDSNVKLARELEEFFSTWLQSKPSSEGEAILESFNQAFVEIRAASILGRKGGSSRSEAKVQASRDNGKLGGRPKAQQAPSKS